MRTSLKERLIEEKVYDAIWEIAEEFDLKVPFYPEIIYVGNRKFDSLGLPEKYRDLFETANSSGGGSMVLNQNVVLIQDYHPWDISEEASHFLHLVNSGIDEIDTLFTDEEERGSIEIIGEMLGYFGSKLLVRDRQHPFFEYPDYLTQKNLFTKETKKVFGDKMHPEEVGVFQQGYCLGERLINAYDLGQITKKEIKNLYSCDLLGNICAIDLLFDLRERLGWPVILPN